MISWDWTRKKIDPDDILDAARTLPRSDDLLSVGLTTGWVPATTYLDWSKAALQRHGADCWDSAAGWAKRAVCRQMDGILKHNHLGCFLGKNYKIKSEYLARLNVPGLNVLRHTVIDPRNGIEHEYSLATKEQAQRAVEVAELFIMATKEEAQTGAVLGLGWKFALTRTYYKDYEEARQDTKVCLTKEHGPLLVINGYPESPEVLVLYPPEEMLSTCPLTDFSSEQVLMLNALLREPLSAGRGYHLRVASLGFLDAMKEQLKL